MPRQGSATDAWIDLFRKASAYASGEEALPDEFAEDEEVKMAIKQVEKVNADVEMRSIIEAQEKWEHDVASRLYDARQKGKEEGRIEGRIEGKIEGKAEGKAEGAEEKALAIAERLLARGVDLATIQQTTELPLAQLLSLQKPRTENPDS